MTTLPTFILGGAQKSGTTTLHHLLSSHPEVFMPRTPQELHFFDFEEDFAKGLNWYSRFFEDADNAFAVGQTSPQYLFLPAVPQRIRDCIPGARLIFILRDPIDRAHSHYWHQVRKGRETLTFEEAIETEEARTSQSFENLCRFSYTARGFYARQVSRFRRFFDEDQILLVRTEDLRKDAGAVLDKCYDHIGVSALGSDVATRARGIARNQARTPRIQCIQRWASPMRGKARRMVKLIDRFNLRDVRYPNMSPETRDRLRELFEDDVSDLRSRYGVDTGGWLKD